MFITSNLSSLHIFVKPSTLYMLSLALNPSRPSLYFLIGGNRVSLMSAVTLTRMHRLPQLLSRLPDHACHLSTPPGVPHFLVR